MRFDVINPSVSPLRATSSEGTKLTAVWEKGQWALERTKPPGSAPNHLTAHLGSTVYGAELRCLTDDEGRVKWVLTKFDLMIYATGLLTDWTPDG
ncbi:hypothetical protein BH23ACT9_BH23ACT9_06320 [soil metagenome]